VVVSDIAKYIHKNENMPILLDRLRKGGKKLFLLTNSEFNYTNSVMTYLLHGANPEYASWRDYFGTDDHTRPYAQWGPLL
jgi:5'-nucleotidase